MLQEDLGILLAIPDLKTFLHSELYEIVEEKSRDILEESGDLTWNIHGNVGNLEDLGILLAIPDLQTFLHSELYEIVEEKSRDILEESPIVSCTKLN